MKIKYLTIIFVLFYVVSFAAWEIGLRSKFIAPKSKIKIVKQEKEVIRYLKQPKTQKDYEDAFNEPIRIGVKMLDNNRMAIIANNNWKETEKILVLDSKSKFPWKPVIVVGGISFVLGGTITGILVSRFMR